MSKSSITSTKCSFTVTPTDPVAPSEMPGRRSVPNAPEWRWWSKRWWPKDKDETPVPVGRLPSAGCGLLTGSGRALQAAAWLRCKLDAASAALAATAAGAYARVDAQSLLQFAVGIPRGVFVCLFATGIFPDQILLGSLSFFLERQVPAGACLQRQNLSTPL